MIVLINSKISLSNIQARAHLVDRTRGVRGGRRSGGLGGRGQVDRKAQQGRVGRTIHEDHMNSKDRIAENAIIQEHVVSDQGEEKAKADNTIQIFLVDKHNGILKHPEDIRWPPLKSNTDIACVEI